MTRADEGRWIAEAARQTYHEAGVPWPPTGAGPVPLDVLIGSYRLVHEEVPGLNHAAVSALLGRWGVRWADIPQPDPPLAGFLYANARRGYIFVRRGGQQMTHVPPLDPLAKSIADFLARGGTIWACPPCVQARGYGQADLLEGVTIVGSSALHAAIKDGAATLSF